MRLRVWWLAILLELEMLIFYTVNGKKTETVYFNSFKDCQGHEVFAVSLFKDYVVKPDISPYTKTHSFRDCELIFGSYWDGGHICLVQVGTPGIITDSNAQLQATNGFGNPEDPVIDTLKSSSNKVWTYREYCSKDTHITLHLSRIQDHSANIRKVNIEFKVMDIESKDRELYLDRGYCDHNFYLKNSMVTLWNRPQYLGMAAHTLTSECAIRFDKMVANHNKSICFAYVPSDDMTCESEWTFIISTADYDLDEKYFVFRLSCNESQAKKITVWCADPHLSFVTVIFWRKEDILSNSSIEPSKDFRFLVMDYEGTQASLLKKVNSMFDSSDGLANKWMIYTIAAVAFVIILAVVIICCRKRMSYKPVNREETTPKVV